jgi:hypothetical protein
MNAQRFLLLVEAARAAVIVTIILLACRIG